MINANNVVVFDEAGIPSIMVCFTKEKNSDLFPGGSDTTHPMFIIDGKEVDEIFISKYPNTIINGKAYSLPYMKPATGLTNEQAAKACFSKGPGWHLMTLPESAFLVLDSKRKGTPPHGNTNCGSYHADPSERGEVCAYGGMTLAGSGPATWAHDHTPYGVQDLCGNVWEMIAGLRLMNGEIQVIENNNAANPVDTSEKSKLWTPVLFDGKPTRYAVDDGSIRLTNEESGEDWDGCRWADVEADIEAPELLKALSLFPASDAENDGWLWVDTEGERLPSRGASWFSASNAGVGALYLDGPRSYSWHSIGFRAAFYRKTEN